MLGVRYPGEMSEREVFEEIAALLARGYLRLKRRSPAEAGALRNAAGTPETAPEIFSEIREDGLDVRGERCPYVSGG